MSDEMYFPDENWNMVCDWSDSSTVRAIRNVRGEGAECGHWGKGFERGYDQGWDACTKRYAVGVYKPTEKAVQSLKQAYIDVALEGWKSEASKVFDGISHTVGYDEGFAYASWLAHTGQLDYVEKLIEKEVNSK